MLVDDEENKAEDLQLSIVDTVAYGAVTGDGSSVLRPAGQFLYGQIRQLLAVSNLRRRELQMILPTNNLSFMRAAWC